MTTEENIIDLPLQTRADVCLEPDSINAGARTIEVLWSTGASVRRRDLFTGRRYDEVLSLDPRHVDLSRLNSGAPLLNAHGAYNLLNVLGVVERAWIAMAGDTFEGRAVVRFSEREDVEPLWQDVRAGIIRSVSVGYAVRAYEVIEQDGQVPIWRAVDWQPVELSAVPIGADQAAGFRERQDLVPCRLIPRAAAAHQPETTAMDQPNPAAETRTAADADTPVQTQEEPVTRDTPEVAVTAAPDRAPQLRTSDQAGDSPAIAEDIARRVVAEERVRIASIYDAARKLAIETGIADDLVRRGITLDEARTVLIDRAPERDRAVETRPHIRTGGLDEREVRRGAVETALLHRFDPHRYAISEPGRDWRGYSLIEMARSFLEAEGVRVRGLSRDEIATRALHTTSDFPAIPRRGHQQYAARCLRGSTAYLPAARPASHRRRLQGHASPAAGRGAAAGEVNESGEFKRGSMGEGKESYRPGARSSASPGR